MQASLPPRVTGIENKAVFRRHNNQAARLRQITENETGYHERPITGFTIRDLLRNRFAHMHHRFFGMLGRYIGMVFLGMIYGLF
jgi:hypothetical protein